MCAQSSDTKVRKLINQLKLYCCVKIHVKMEVLMTLTYGKKQNNIHTQTHTHTHIYIYIYIYINRVIQREKNKYGISKVVYIYIYIYICDHGVMVIVVGNGHGDTSSNPGLIAFHIALIPSGKVWIQLFSLQLWWVNSRAD